MHYVINNFAVFSSGITTMLCKSGECSERALLSPFHLRHVMARILSVIKFQLKVKLSLCLIS
jgi:hypothetical protein